MLTHDVCVLSIQIKKYYEIKPGFETGPNGHRTLVCTHKLDKYLKMPYKKMARPNKVYQRVEFELAIILT